MSDTPGDLFRAGKLTAAIEAANQTVKKSPTDLGARVLLAEMLLFAGNIERADVVLDAASQIEPEAALVVAEFRQLLRAETARRQLRRDGRVPEFLGDMTVSQAEMLAAMVALRAGDNEAAAKHAAEAESLRPRVPGSHDGEAFDDFRDACDLHAGFFEVLTTTGKYFWVPTERVISVEFHKAIRPRDLAWRRASMSVADGPDGDVYIPVTYGNDDPALSDLLRLGRQTEWIETAGLVRGQGQRVFLSGEDADDIMELGVLEFEQPDVASDDGA